MAHAIRFRRKYQSEFSKVFHSLCERQHDWQVWADFITLSAIEIACSVDRTSSDRKSRMTEYKSIMERYCPEERQKFAKLFILTVNALETNPEQDFLGEIFMGLNLGNHWKGQFFTPYSICQMIASIQTDVAQKNVQSNGWTSIYDPACGAGALLVALRNEAVRKQISPDSLLFVAQDIDRVAAMMCYIQISLLGCAGYVVVGDSLSNPVAGESPLLPVQNPGQEFWFTPIFFDPIWKGRRDIAQLAKLFNS